MIGNKKYVIIFCIFVFSLVVFNAIIWFCFTKDLQNRDLKYKTGDLTRVGYLPEYASPRINFNTLPKKHLEFKDYKGQLIDMIVIGDSFAQGGGGGENSFFQDYIATYNDFEVLNIPRYRENISTLNTAFKLVNSGFIEKVKPRYLLIELVERSCTHTTSINVDYFQTANIEDMIGYYNAYEDDTIKNKKNSKTDVVSNIDFFNSGNIKYIFYKIGYKLSENAFFSKTHISEMNRKLFSGDRGDVLIYYEGDIRPLGGFLPQDKANIEKFNKNVNELADLLNNYDIELILMPIPDKYTIYQPYLNNPIYPKGNFFEILRELPKKYTFIDAEELIAEEVAAGVADMYWQDDTHWSYRAPEAIFKKFRFD